MSANGNDVFVQLCASNTTKCLHVNVSGCIEKVSGEYRNIAYLQKRLTDNTENKVIGMAAAFVCLQA